MNKETYEALKMVVKLAQYETNNRETGKKVFHSTRRLHKKFDKI
jgi:hypothetical protein